ncbi:hypothetical protein [Thermoactinomyces mirandus]|nr:hypothetical protein [Thermoactinomyces mirandus]
MSDYLEQERGFEFQLLYNGVNKKFRERAGYIKDYNFYITDKLQKTVLDGADQIHSEVLDRLTKKKDKLY